MNEELPASLIPQDVPGPSLEEIEAEAETQYRNCTSCKLQFELTSANFHRDSYDDAGFQRMCKKCRSEARKRERNAKISEFAETMQEQAVKLLEEAVAGNVILEQLPHTTTILEDLLSCFGGSQGFARMIFADYLSAPPGGQTRLRFAQLVVKMVEQVSADGFAKSRHDKMTDGELHDDIWKILRKVMHEASDDNIEKLMKKAAEDDDAEH